MSEKGFFGKKSKEDKQQAKTEAMLEEYGLSEVSEVDLKAIKQISNSLISLNLMKSSMTFSFGKAEEQAKVGYLSALVEQNWIIIRQLDSLNKKLNK